VKTFLSTKLFRAYRMKSIRHKKSIRDHGDKLGRRMLPDVTRERTCIMSAICHEAAAQRISVTMLGRGC